MKGFSTMETCTHTNSNSNRRIRAHPSNASIPRIIIIYTFIVHMKIHYFSRRKFSDHHVGCYMNVYLIYRCLFHIVVFFVSFISYRTETKHTHTHKKPFHNKKNLGSTRKQRTMVVTTTIVGRRKKNLHLSLYLTSIRKDTLYSYIQINTQPGNVCCVSMLFGFTSSANIAQFLRFVWLFSLKVYLSFQ